MKNLNKIILSLGTNLGKREINLKDCLGELSKISSITADEFREKVEVHDDLTVSGSNF